MPRIVRKETANAKPFYTRWTYRKALPLLLKDFEERCAYTRIHSKSLGGGRQLHVDHFNPKLKSKSPYENLFPAYGPCNKAKGESWPVKSQLDKGLRFLNPCEEDDYGVQIFEDPDTHKLVPANQAASYHIDTLDLDCALEQRKQRALIQRILDSGIVKDPKMKADIEETLKISIPPIPPPPAGFSYQIV